MPSVSVTGGREFWQRFHSPEYFISKFLGLLVRAAEYGNMAPRSPPKPGSMFEKFMRIRFGNTPAWMCDPPMCTMLISLLPQSASESNLSKKVFSLFESPLSISLFAS